MLKETGPSEDAYEESSKKGELNWTFIEKKKVFGMVTSMTERMTLFEDKDIHKVLSSQYTYERFDKELIKSILDSIQLERCNVYFYS